MAEEYWLITYVYTESTLGTLRQDAIAGNPVDYVLTILKGAKRKIILINTMPITYDQWKEYKDKWLS